MSRMHGWAVVVALVLGGCAQEEGGHHDHDHAHGEGAASGANCPSGSTLTYETFGRGFMAQYCTRCHSSSLQGAQRQGAPSDHNFDSLAALKAVGAEHVDTAAAAGPSAVNTVMPPQDPRPSEAERRQLGEWLACGMP